MQQLRTTSSTEIARLQAQIGRLESEVTRAQQTVQDTLSAYVRPRGTRTSFLEFATAGHVPSVFVSERCLLLLGHDEQGEPCIFLVRSTNEGNTPRPLPLKYIDWMSRALFGEDATEQIFGDVYCF